jgi:3-dehydroquinate synthase
MFDLSLLRSLPLTEWQNGFAEVIKHACIKDAALFSQLEKGSLPQYKRGAGALAQLVRRNVLIKTRVVQQDQWEQGDRRLLNFGHTLGHALENRYELSHGQAIAIGMTYAARISERVIGFKDADRVARLLDKYGLPTFAHFDLPGALAVMAKDKKKIQSAMNYVLLQRVGKGVVHPLTMKELGGLLQSVL